LPRFLAAFSLVVMLSAAGVRPEEAHRIDAWTTEQGPPHGSINAVPQASDGFLWLPDAVETLPQGRFGEPGAKVNGMLAEAETAATN
jgi:hypothetical protein